MTRFYHALIGLSLISLPTVASAAVLDYEMDPEDGAKVTEFTDITFDFGTSVSQDFDLAFGSTPAATLTGNGDTFSPVVTLSPAGGGVLRFYTPPTEPGTYELHVVAGLFVADNGDTSPEISATFTLVEDDNQGGDESEFLSYKMTPANGSTVSEISDITFDFGTAVTQDFDLAFGSKPAATLTGNGDTFSPVVTLSPAGGGVLRFYTPPTKPGKYELYVVEGLFVTDDGMKSPEITATITISDEAAQDWYTDIVLTPADGEVVESLKKIEIHFEGLADGLDQNYNLSGRSAAFIINSTTSEEYTPVAVTLSGDCESGVLTFNEITEPGTYQLWVAAGLFIDYETESPSPELRATYIIKGEESDDWYTSIEFTPEDGATVESLKKIEIHFSGLADGLDQNYNLSGVLAAKLSCGDKEYYPLAVTLSGDCESGVLTFESITEPGTYQLWVAKGLFTDYSSNAPSPELTATFIISATDGITEVEAAGADAEIFDLEGRKVLGSLAPGIYISGGKKVIVK